MLGRHTVSSVALIFCHAGALDDLLQAPRSKGCHLSEVCAAIRKHHDLVICANRFAPGIHDKSIIYSNTCDGVNTLGL